MKQLACPTPSPFVLKPVHRLCRQAAVAAAAAWCLSLHAAPIDIALPAQPLANALRSVATQAGLTLQLDEAALAGRQSVPLSGRFEADEALARLLEGSGFRLVRQGTVVTVAPAGPTPDATLREVVISASADSVNRYVGVSGNAAARLPADPMDLPVSGVSIPRAVLEDQGVLRPAEALRNVSAVTRTPAYMGLTDTYRIRGFPADVGLWNGFRRDFYYTFTDPVHLERVEVIKGGASVTYGDLEPGGVVNYVTRRPSRNPVNSVGLTVGSHGLVRPEFDVGTVTGEDGNVRLRITGASERGESFRDFVDSRHSTLGATLDWDLAPGTRLELSGYWLDSTVVPDRGFFNSMGPVVLDLPIERFLGEPDDRYRFQQAELSAMLHHRVNDTTSLRAGVNRYRVEDERDNFQFRNLQPDGQTIRRFYTYVPTTNIATTVFAEGRFDLKHGAVRHNIVAGVERLERDDIYDFQRSAGDGNLLNIFNPVYGQGLRERVGSDRYATDVQSDGLYLQDLISVGEQWRFLAGVRQSRYRQLDNAVDAGTVTRFRQSETSPRFGVLYRITPEHSVFASHTSSFSPQRFNYTSLRPGTEPTPERGRQVELGYKYTALDERLVAGVTLFDIRKRNVGTTDPSDPSYTVLTGEQTVRGLEMDVSAKLGRGTTLIASYAWLDGFVSQDNDIPAGDTLVNTPRHQASAWVRHEFAGVPGVAAGLGLVLVGQREAQLPNTWQIPGYGRVDAAVFWKVSPALDLAVHLKNVTDKRYYDSQNNLLYPGAPRSVQATARWKF